MLKQENPSNTKRISALACLPDDPYITTPWLVCFNDLNGF